MSTSGNFPNIGSPMVGPDGRLSPEWFGFFIAIFTRTGGQGTPPDIPSLQGQVDQQADEIAGLFSEINASASSVMISALVAKIAYLEQTILAAVPIPTRLIQATADNPVSVLARPFPDQGNLVANPARPTPIQDQPVYAPTPYLFPSSRGNAGQVLVSGGPIAASVWSSSLSLSTLTVTDTTGLVNALALIGSSGNGASLQFTGNGSTTPKKAIRVNGGAFQIINDAYNAVLLNLDDVGDLTLSGGLSFAPATTTTAPAAGSAGAPPATPAGYATVSIGGTPRKLVYY